MKHLAQHEFTAIRRNLKVNRERDETQAVARTANAYQRQHPGMTRQEAVVAAEAAIERDKRRAWPT